MYNSVLPEPRFSMGVVSFEGVKKNLPVQSSNQHLELRQNQYTNFLVSLQITKSQATAYVVSNHPPLTIRSTAGAQKVTVRFSTILR